MTVARTGAIGPVIVVDDDHDTTDSIRDTLRRRGFDVAGVYSAEDCLQRLATHEVEA